MPSPERRGPWIVRSSEERFSNPWITLREDAVVQPDGEEGAFGVVTMKPGTCVLPISRDGMVRLIRVYRYAIDRESLEAVAGGIEDGEAPEDAARRELSEEAGIDATEFEAMGVIDQLTETVVSPCHLFVARDLAFGKPDPEGSESMRTVDTTLAEAEGWALDGTITHAASALLILKAAAARPAPC